MCAMQETWLLFTTIAISQVLFPHPTTPRDTLIADQRRACAARPRGKAGSERRKACFHPGGSGFHLPRGRVGRQCRLPVIFNWLSRHTQVLCFFLDSRKKRNPSFPPSSSPRLLRLPYTSTGTSARRRRLYSPPNRTGRPVISRRARAYQRS